MKKIEGKHIGCMGKINGMSLRDLRLFNQALLAKQVWHLFVYPDSLCEKLFKEKYCPQRHILDTVFPYVA